MLHVGVIGPPYLIRQNCAGMKGRLHNNQILLNPHCC